MFGVRSKVENGFDLRHMVLGAVLLLLSTNHQTFLPSLLPGT